MNTCPSFRFGWKLIDGCVEPFTWPKSPRREITEELRQLVHMVSPVVRDVGEVTISCHANEEDPSRVLMPRIMTQRCSGGVIGQILFIAMRGASDLWIAHSYQSVMYEPLKQAVAEYTRQRGLTVQQLGEHHFMLLLATPMIAFSGGGEEQPSGMAIVIGAEAMFDPDDRGWFIRASSFPEELPFGSWVNAQTRDRAHNMLIEQVLGKPIAEGTDSTN